MKYSTLFISVLVCVLLMLSGCSDKNIDKGVGEMSYKQVTAEEAKSIMDSEKDYIILDVRTQEEYSQGHIPNAILIPHYSISDESKEILKDKEQLILVYCRSGNRSKVAAEALTELGYTNVVEFGGINDWKYDIVKWV